MGEFSDTVGDIKADTFNKLTDTIQSQMREIRRLEALLSGADPGNTAEFEKQMEVATFEIGSLIAPRNRQGYVELKWGASVCQMSPEEARGHAFTILHFAEIAGMEALFYRFALHIAEGDEQDAVPLLMSFRDFRAEQEKEKTQ